MKSKTRNYILLITSILLIGVVSVFANTVITNSNIVNSNITTNDSGQYYNGAKTSVRTADVVVCRGTSLLDDLYKYFTCDVVVASTDTDACGDIQGAINSLTNGGTIVVMPGTYNISSQIDYSAINMASCILINRNNINLFGYGATLTPNYELSSGNYYDDAILINGSNNYVAGFKIVDNNALPYSATQFHVGIQIRDGSNNIIENNFINMSSNRSHAMQVNCYGGNTLNNKIIKNTLYSYNADTIGGGTSVVGCNISDLLISNNYVYQLATFYTNAIDLTRIDRAEVSDNLVYGGVWFGGDAVPNTNLKVVNNIIKPQAGSTVFNRIQLASNTYPSQNSEVSGNVLYNSGIEMYTVNSVISNNILYIDPNTNYITTASIYCGTNCARNSISNNVIINSTVDGIQYLGSSGTINNNQIYTNTTAPAGAISALSVGTGGNGIKIFGNVIKATVGTQYAITVNGNTNATLEGNTILGGTFGTNSNSYSPEYTYGVINQTNNPCATTSIFNEHTIHNLTSSCTCISGAWKCWAMA